MTLKAPFPYFGGKSTIAHLVWERFGRVNNYVEPFFGSGAVLLKRPPPFGVETVNDADGMVCNFWRAVAKDPEGVAKYADWPVDECSLHARHIWLVGQKESLQARLEGDPDYFDVKIAGWWCWGMCCWIGHGFCSGIGPWHVEDGKLVDGGSGGVWKQVPYLRGAGQGMNSQGTRRKLPHLGDAGKGINRQRVHLADNGKGIHSQQALIYEWMQDLSERLRRVRVCCGDWSRITGPSVTIQHGLTGVFLDPPYSDEAARDMTLYTKDCGKVAHDARAWCIEWGEHPLMRIALCGYEGEHEMPKTWECVAWKANGGYAGQAKDECAPGLANRTRERIWFSPNCLKPELNLL
jgi:site-specific DNA-adenine methylase